MKSSKRKSAIEPSKKNLFKSAPAVFFLLGFLLVLFFIDLYIVVNNKNKTHDHIRPRGESADKKIVVNWQFIHDENSKT